MSTSTEPGRTCWDRLRRFGLGLAILCAAACGSGDPATGSKGHAGAAPNEPARNVLLVVLDTTRADRLTCYGGPAGATPHLDRLASEGVRFERAYSHAPWTLPSTASLLTSLHPKQHGAGGSLHLTEGELKPDFRPLAPQIDTIAEVFQRAGWETGAVVNVEFLTPSFGLMQGVDHLDARIPRSNLDGRPAARTTDAALAWLGEQGDGSTFLLVHYFDPHAVYAPPAEFRSRFADPRDREDDSFVFGTREELLRLRAGELELEPDTIQRASSLYDGEIAYADAEIGRLLAGLEDLGRADSTVVVFTSDHGEEFLDHGGFEHGHTLFDELIRVPLIVRFPGAIPPGVVADPVRHIDVAPTLCRLAGIPSPGAFAGRDLFAPGARPTLSHGNFWGDPKTSWLSGDYKLVLEPVEGGEPTLELYHLTDDPGERTNLAEAEPETVARLLAELREHRIWSSAIGEGGEGLELSDEERARLEAIGYIPSSSD